MRPWASRVTSARGSGSSDRIDVLTGYPGRPGGHPERFDAGDMRIAEHDPRNRAVVVAYAVAVEGIQGGDLRVMGGHVVEPAAISHIGGERLQRLIVKDFAFAFSAR